jgi:nucleoid-associated protein YgaU
VPKSPYERFGKSAIDGETQTTARHIIVGGETIPSIAASEYQTGYDSELWRQLAEANDIDDIEALTVNTALDVPPPASSET